VVGVNTAVLLEQGGVPLQNIGYAIGIARVREIVGQLRRKESLSWLGTGLQFPPARQLRAEGLPAGVLTLGPRRARRRRRRA
jgi:S1-C subfamily serine protease